MYQGTRNRQYGRRTRLRPSFVPYVQWALDKHKELSATLFINAFGVMITTNKNGIAWVKKEMVRLQKIAYKRELKK